MAGNFRLATRLIEHQRYLADVPRIDAFTRALAEVVRPTDAVLDLGCGTGILGLLALRAGARHVYAVDDGPVLELARQIAHDNGLSERVTFIRGSSSDITLPERADLVVADQMAPFGLGAGLVRYLGDARERLLTPQARYLPAALTLRLAPVAAAQAQARVNTFRQPLASFDVSAALPIMENMGQNLCAAADQLYAAPEDALRISLMDPPSGLSRSSLAFSAARSGKLHGMLGCFVAHLTNDITFSNDPTAAQPIDRDQLFLPTGELTVAAGDALDAELHIQHDAQVVSWRMWRRGAPKPPLRSTFAGMLIDRPSAQPAA